MNRTALNVMLTENRWMKCEDREMSVRMILGDWIRVVAMGAVSGPVLDIL